MRLELTKRLEEKRVVEIVVLDEFDALAVLLACPLDEDVQRALWYIEWITSDRSAQSSAKFWPTDSFTHILVDVDPADGPDVLDPLEHVRPFRHLLKHPPVKPLLAIRPQQLDGRVRFPIRGDGHDVGVAIEIVVAHTERDWD